MGLVRIEQKREKSRVLEFVPHQPSGLKDIKSTDVPVQFIELRVANTELGQRSDVFGTFGCHRGTIPKEGFPLSALAEGESKRDYLSSVETFIRPRMAACAAARRAIGTRNGEQDT